MLKEEGIRYSFFAPYPGYAEDIVRRAEHEGFQMTIACGGDGTVHEIVNGVIGADVILGIVPMGRGRDLARNLGIDNGISSSIYDIKRGVVKKTDVVRVNSSRYLQTENSYARRLFLWK